MKTAQSDSDQGFGSNMLWGMVVGLFMAALASAYVLIVSVLRGSFYFETYGVGGGRIVMTYFAGGLGGGAIAGALRPLTRWPLGGATVGALAGVFVYFAVGLAMGEPPVAALVMAGFLGSAVGGLMGFELSSDSPEDRHTLVVSATEAPAVRVIQAVGITVVVLGATTCTVGAASESAVAAGFWLFGLGLTAAVVSQFYVWARRLWVAITRRGLQ